MINTSLEKEMGAGPRSFLFLPTKKSAGIIEGEFVGGITAV